MKGQKKIEKDERTKQHEKNTMHRGKCRYLWPANGERIRRNKIKVSYVCLSKNYILMQGNALEEMRKLVSYLSHKAGVPIPCLPATALVPLPLALWRELGLGEGPGDASEPRSHTPSSWHSSLHHLYNPPPPFPPPCSPQSTQPASHLKTHNQSE